MMHRGFAGGGGHGGRRLEEGDADSLAEQLIHHFDVSGGGVTRMRLFTPRRGSDRVGGSFVPVPEHFAEDV